MFRIKFEGEHLTRRWELVVKKTEQLDDALKAFAQYLRKKTSDRFKAEGPGWPGYATSTNRKLLHSYTGQFTSSGKLRKAYAKKLRRSVERGIKTGKLPMRARSEMNRLIRGSISNDSLALRAFGHVERKKTAKEQNSVEKLAAKMEKLKDASQRAKALAGKRAIASTKLLGKLAGTIRSSIKKNTLTVFSQVEWAGTHNDGGTGGHGAKIPERKFLYLEDDDLAVLATILEGELQEVLDDG
jgi:phage gpG-like protein